MMALIRSEVEAERKVMKYELGRQGTKVPKTERIITERLGELVGFSQSKISKIENVDWDSLSDLRLIARVLEVPIEELGVRCMM